jgi:uncharacterized protein HemX
MTPTEKPFDSKNEPENTNNQPLSSPASDAAALEAIEALEAESNQFPETPNEATPTSAVTTPSPSTPETTPPSTPVVSTQASSAPSPDIAASLNEEPTAAPSTEFQPFAKKKSSSKKIVIIVIAALLIIALGVGGYFGWQYLQSQNNGTPAMIIPEKETDEDTVLTEETAITEAITEIESELDTIEDTEYTDETLSDETLYN